MEFLLLWSGEVRGMRKARIPAVPATGFLSRTDERGALVAPKRDAIRAALPKRLRPAFDRAHLADAASRIGEANGRQSALFYDLVSADDRPITRLYLQPLDADWRDRRRAGAPTSILAEETRP